VQEKHGKALNHEQDNIQRENSHDNTKALLQNIGLQHT